MFDVSIFADIEIPFTGIEKALCVLEYARSQSKKTVQHAFEREFSKQSPTTMQIWKWHKDEVEMATGFTRNDILRFVALGLCKWTGVCHPANRAELRQIMTTALQSVIQHMLQRALEELEHRCDVCRVSGGADIEHL